MFYSLYQYFKTIIKHTLKQSPSCDHIIIDVETGRLPRIRV
jgi:hypothetical protein